MEKNNSNKFLVIIITALFIVTNFLSVSAGVLYKNQFDNLLKLNGENVIIVRDNYGVPHVYADSNEALSYGAGYALAEDRLWQLEYFKRFATGRLAEIGLSSLDYDLYIRQIGYNQDELTDLFNELKSPYSEMIDAFSQGINCYINETLDDPENKLPKEYEKYNIPLEHWTVEDSIAISHLMMWVFGRTESFELFYLQILSVLIQHNGLVNGWKIFNDVFPLYDPDADSTLNWKNDGNSESFYSFPPLSLIFSQSIKKYVDRINEIEEVSHQCPQLFELKNKMRLASNAWVVTSEKSESGKPLLVGGPQVSQSVPNWFMEIGIHGAGIDAVGVTFPGMGPYILIGVSKWGSWTVTKGNSDNTDTYIEILHPFKPSKYLYKGKWVDMVTRSETIVDRFGNSHEYMIYRTVHGPTMYIDGSPIAVSEKSVIWKQEANGIEALMGFQECRNLTDFENKVRKSPYSLNYFWIDGYGDVAYYHGGLYPIRPNKGFFGIFKNDRRFPLLGTGKQEWKGFIPFEELPQEKNPSEGFYANWNNKPHPDWKQSEYEILWGPSMNIKMIQEKLDQDPSISYQDMINICRDVSYYNAKLYESHEIRGVLFTPYILNAIKDVEDIPQDVITSFKEWDFRFIDSDSDGFYDNPATTIFQEWYYELQEKVFEDEIPNSLGIRSLLRPLLLHILQGKESNLTLQYQDYLNGIPRDELIVDLLKNTLQNLENEFDSNNISQWLTPATMVKFSPEGELQDFVIPWMDRGSYNQIVEMPLWNTNKEDIYPIAMNVLPPGQSGFINSSDQPNVHAFDQIELYITWQFKPILFKFDEVLAVSESIKTLQWTG